MARRPGPWTRLMDHFHEHPQGRVHEFAFWFSIGAVSLLLTYFGWRGGVLNTAFALLFGVIALCFIGWSFLPQGQRKKPEPARHPKSKRR